MEGVLGGTGYLSLPFKDVYLWLMTVYVTVPLLYEVNYN